MSSSCGCSTNPRFDGMSPGYRRALWAVIAINATMFLFEMTAGAIGASQALKADALDFLGDTATYGLSLAVIGRSVAARSGAALFKGISLGIMGFGVLCWTLWRVFVLGQPSAGIMGGVGALALAANLISVLILMRYKDGDANVRSVWLCSRNDALGNLAVILAAGGVWASGGPWPDLAVAGIMASLFLWSSVAIIRQALEERRAASVMVSPHSSG